MATVLKFDDIRKGPSGDFYVNKHYFRDGNVMLYQRADHGNRKWQARYRIDGIYKVRSLRTTDFAQAHHLALEEYDEFRFKLKHGLPVHERKFHDVADEFIEFGKRRMERDEISRYWLSTASSIIKVWKKYLGDVDITKIPAKKVEKYIDWRNNNNRYNRNMALETLVTEISYLRQCLFWARDQKYVSEHQLPNIPLPKIPQHKRRKRYALSLDEYRHLYRFMRSWVKAPDDPESRYDREILRHFVLFLANTGLRPGSETKDLRWKDIDPDRGDGHIYIWITGGKRGSGECVAQPRLKPTLDRWRKLAKHNKDNDLVFDEFHNDRGMKNKYTNLFNSLMEEAGLRISRQGTNNTLYAMRHTYITFALRYGKSDVFFIAKNCRTSVKRIEDHYGHVLPSDFADAVTARK